LPSERGQGREPARPRKEAGLININEISNMKQIFSTLSHGYLISVVEYDHWCG
jgi:hypothetical protein